MCILPPSPHCPYVRVLHHHDILALGIERFRALELARSCRLPPPSPKILTSIPEERIAQMQRRLSRVWHRFAYTRGKVDPGGGASQPTQRAKNILFAFTHLF